jgi:hypothetical protein
MALSNARVAVQLRQNVFIQTSVAQKNFDVNKSSGIFPFKELIDVSTIFFFHMIVLSNEKTNHSRRNILMKLTGTKFLA